MARVKAGDLAAFEQLVDRFKNMVYGLAQSILRSPEDAEEAAQDAFLKLFRARDSFDLEREVEPWLLRIAGNACRDLLRRRRVGRVPTLADVDGGQLAEALPDHRQLEHQDQAATDQLVRHELGQLSEKMRVPLELKYMRGMTNHQIAAALGISVSNVKVQVARGKDLLQSRLERVIER